MSKPIPHRNWILRVRKLLCVQYQELCQISMAESERLQSGKGNTFTPKQKQQLESATCQLSGAIDAINDIVNLPKGS